MNFLVYNLKISSAISNSKILSRNKISVISDRLLSASAFGLLSTELVNANLYKDREMKNAEGVLQTILKRY